MHERNYGLDVARTIAMGGVVILHILASGGVWNTENINTINYWIEWAMEICAYCSVDLFALLSGYLGFESENWSMKRVVELIFITFFYCCIITFSFIVVYPNVFQNIKEVVYSIWPALRGNYWYITCYIPLALFRPYLNKGLKVLNDNQHANVCVLSILFFSIMPNIMRCDFFAFNSGYSFVWLLECYIIGAYLRRKLYTKKIRWEGIGCFGVSAIILFSINLLAFRFQGGNPIYLIDYTSPLILVMGICILLFCKDIEIKKTKKLWVTASTFAFDVMLLHGHFIVDIYVLEPCLRGLASCRAIILPLYVFIIMIIIYLTSTIIGLCRSKLFALIHIDKLYQLVDDVFQSKWYSNV